MVQAGNPRVRIPGRRTSLKRGSFAAAGGCVRPSHRLGGGGKRCFPPPAPLSLRAARETARLTSRRAKPPSAARGRNRARPGVGLRRELEVGHTRPDGRPRLDLAEVLRLAETAASRFTTLRAVICDWSHHRRISELQELGWNPGNERRPESAWVSAERKVREQWDTGVPAARRRLGRPEPLAAHWSDLDHSGSAAQHHRSIRSRWTKRRRSCSEGACWLSSPGC
jgi:hypothetical protein